MDTSEILASRIRRICPEIQIRPNPDFNFLIRKPLLREDFPYILQYKNYSIPAGFMPGMIRIMRAKGSDYGYFVDLSLRKRGKKFAKLQVQNIIDYIQYEGHYVLSEFFNWSLLRV